MGQVGDTSGLNIEALRVYARQGILAVTAINSGAMLAAITQISELRLIAPGETARAFLFWGAGLSLSVLLWLFAFMAASAYAHAEFKSERKWSCWGLAGFVAAVAFFLFGCWSLSGAFMLGR